MLNKYRFMSLMCAGLYSLLAFGCDRAADEQKNAYGAQAEANQEIAEVKREAHDKTVNAQVEADKKIADAQANFMKLREDFRHETTNNLLEIDRRITNLEAEAKTLAGKQKADLESKLATIRTQREQFSKDYQTIEAASASTWDEIKVRLQKQWKDLEKAVHAAP